MKYFKKLAMCALLLPAGAFAADPPPEEGQVSESTAQASENGAETSTLPTPDPDRPTTERSAAEYMTTTPEDAVRVNNVIGGSLHMRSDDEEIGIIEDLILDKSGQVIAVVVSMGGFLGIGEYPVAISWDSVERTLNEDRDGYLFSVNVTEESLGDAPAFDEDSTGIRASRSARE